MPRLPIPGGDDGNWGTILNDFLLTSLAADGSLLAASNIASNTSSISTNTSDIASLTTTVASKYELPSTRIPESDLSDAVQTKLNSSGGGATALAGLSDVSTAGATNTMVLTYNGSSWVAAAPTGGGGTTDHGALTGLGDDDHSQYALADGSRGDFEISGSAISSMSSHVSNIDPHPQYQTQTESDARYVQPATMNSSISSAVSTHASDTDPHGDRAYTDAQTSGITTQINSAVSTHTSAADPHGDRAYTDSVTPSTLSDLSDVATTAPSNGQILTFNAGSWGPVTGTGGAITSLNDIDGTNVTSPVDVNNQSIVNVPNPTNGTDVANRAYVDAAVGAGGSIPANSITNVELAAGTVRDTELATDSVTNIKIQDNAVTTAKINNAAVDNSKLATNAVAATNIQDGAVTTSKIGNNAVTTAQLATSISLTDLDGTKVTTDVDLNSNKLTNLATPTNNTDAATKAYVDTEVAGAGGGWGGRVKTSSMHVASGPIAIPRTATVYWSTITLT